MEPRSQGSTAAAKPPSRDHIPSFPVLLLLAGLFRVVLISYGVFHDARQALKYTDIDYYVFSDASSFILKPQSVAAGPYGRHLAAHGYTLGSPYDRATYRYTPLLAILLLPNTLVHPLFGKVLFAAADLVIGYLLYSMLRNHGAISPSQAKINVSLVWLFNPIVANISTRGSAEAVLGVMVIGILAAADRRHWRTAAVVFGLAVHFKLYPIIYAAPILAKLSTPDPLLNNRQLFFGAYSFATFAAINRIMHILWGQPFLEHTFLYHLTRLDHRHNFSQHFYPIYLQVASGSSDMPVYVSSLAILQKVAQSSFVPQLGLTALIGFGLGNRAPLPFVCFIQTMVFVTFNRVCTSQYFMWSLWFLPLILPNLRVSKRGSITMLGLWIAGQAVWLSFGYRLEFLGQEVFLELFGASVTFFVISVAVICYCLSSLRAIPAQRI